MTHIAENHRRLAANFAAKAGEVPAGRWDSPTPCPEWTARQLMQHMADTCGLFLGFIGRELPPLPSVDDDPVATWLAADVAIQRALDDPAVAGQTYQGYAGPTTFEKGIAGFADFDLVVHGWDLARAAGIDERLDPGDVHTVFLAAEAMGDMLRGSGVFGPAVPAPEGADEQARLLAFLGRNPAAPA